VISLLIRVNLNKQPRHLNHGCVEDVPIGIAPQFRFNIFNTTVVQMARLLG